MVHCSSVLERLLVTVAFDNAQTLRSASQNTSELYKIFKIEMNRNFMHISRDQTGFTPASRLFMSAYIFCNQYAHFNRPPALRQRDMCRVGLTLLRWQLWRIAGARRGTRQHALE